jgi:uncharacterized protein YmfQ (DUF2313 family)
MARSSDDYKKLLQSLLPKGKLWNRDPNSVLAQILAGLAVEYSRIDGRSEDLLDESFVTKTTELITEHEEDFGLPDEGFSLASTTEKRREDLLFEKQKVGQQDKGYFESIAQTLGYDITIVEYSPFIVGATTVNNPVGDLENLFYWLVGIDVDSVTESAEVNISRLIAKINKIKPAHTIALYDFYGAGFSRGFSIGYNRIPSYDNSWIELGFGRGFSNGFANAYDYDGVNYVGGFSQGFNIGFDRKSGGGFKYNAFSTAFAMPA